MLEIAIVNVVFWAGIFLLFRSLVRARTARHELEIHRLKMNAIGSAPNTVSAAPIQLSGPSKSALLFRSIWKGIRWTAPRLLAGLVVTGSFSRRTGKRIARKANSTIRAWHQARVAKAKAAAAAPAYTQPAGGNVLSPEQEKELSSTPAYMRKGARTTHEGHTLH
ncbi:hypothetical protein [Acidithiobacillus caldus]|uniref:Uncharacterized protein n=1 Tax=Acidithiobacillus caldus TaxID=33059 RepID=A0A1E7YPT2_9PROT|nr:hypothetical protein [Acidithiobacillus caldus]OFC37971.1 hypothetical protein BAE27_03230 [Acidithiobacillus caldus]OFC38412.1 hypothetical protein BAE28_05565 [Acidithiobacillus caldus]OFC40008.1 hypothetical protein BAE29_06180 [Acidithiobacillus caldus]OFC44599.1 hypothetical protein BAE30_14195 [Acidithiobacillus caldus]